MRIKKATVKAVSYLACIKFDAQMLFLENMFKIDAQSSSFGLAAVTLVKQN